MDPTSLDPITITVSLDGSWHKLGHMSMYSMAAVIEVLTGLVDYVVLSKYCHACSLKKTDFYEESFNAMEVEAAVRLEIFGGASQSSLHMISQRQGLKSL